MFGHQVPRNMIARWPRTRICCCGSRAWRAGGGSFDALVDDLRKRWDALAGSDRLRSFGTIRDKFLAHAELHHGSSNYRSLDVTSVGVTWEHLKQTIVELEELVTLVTAIYRSAAFAFPDLDAQLARASSAF
jgi:hypothetical protein